MQRGLAERIERAALWAWPPRETAHVDGWLLRAGSPGGRTRRVDSVRTPAFAAHADVGKAIGRVDAWQARHKDAFFAACDGWMADFGEVD